ncbi:MAG: replication initiation factor domain-containing protein [Erysipelotrichaceae bacterium]|nr:replication initiation factor domain-containing protein [Erysipelotrichaceae bacterium]
MNEDSIQQTSVCADGKGAAHAQGVSNTPAITYKAIETSIDYFKVRLDFTYESRVDAHVEAVDEILKRFYLTRDMEVKQPKGFSNYANAYKFDEDFVICSGGELTKANGVETMLIEMKGDACDRFLRRASFAETGSEECAPELAVKAWSNVFQYLLTLPHKVTRFDIPVDSVGDLIPLEELKEKCRNKVFTTRCKRKKEEKEILEGEDEDSKTKQIIDGLGWSYVLGTRESARQLTIYDKKAESEAHGFVVNVATWIRFETRYYGEMANLMFDQLAEAYKTLDALKVQQFIVGCLSTIICFREHRLSGNNSNKAPIWGPWKELIDMGMEPQKVKLAKTVLTIKQNAVWLKGSTDRTSTRMHAVYIEDGADVDRYLLADGIAKLDKEDLAVVNAGRRDIGRPEYETVQEMQAALFQKYGLDKIPSDDVLAIFDEKIAVNVVPIKEEKQEGGKE